VGCGPDLIEEGSTGWVFRAGSEEDLRHALEKAARNRTELAAMGSRLRQRVTSGYSFAKATNLLLQAVGAVDKRPEDRRSQS
jgi:glycosyltransferase involved in cell wall biosynthesis